MRALPVILILVAAGLGALGQDKKAKQAEPDVPKNNITVPSPVYDFNGTGNTSLYNTNRQLVQKGYFENGKLRDGKWYFYHHDGELERVEIYKNGKFIGTE